MNMNSLYNSKIQSPAVLNFHVEMITSWIHMFQILQRRLFLSFKYSLAKVLHFYHMWPINHTSMLLMAACGLFAACHVHLNGPWKILRGPIFIKETSCWIISLKWKLKVWYLACDTWELLQEIVTKPQMHHAETPVLLVIRNVTLYIKNVHDKLSHLWFHPVHICFLSWNNIILAILAKSLSAKFHWGMLD